MTHLLPLCGRLIWIRWLLCFAVLGGFALRVTAEDKAPPAAPALTCEVRYHFRERLEGVKPGGKQYSAPSYEKEVVTKGRVAHLPYRFEIKPGEKGAGIWEVNILDGEGKPLRGYPKTMPPVADAANPASQEFELPIGPKLARKIEKTLLGKNQHLTQVQLMLEPLP